MTDNQEPEAAVVERLARAAAGVQLASVDANQVPFVLVREQAGDDSDYVRVLDLQGYATRPTRRSGTAAFDDQGSFERYVNEFKDTDTTRLYASLQTGEVIAVFNDDDPALPEDESGSWRDHRASLRLVPTPEWIAWCRDSGKLREQVEFAEFLEEHLGDVIEPDAAELIEIARSFTASNKIAFRSAINLTSGETRFQYDEELEAKAGTTAQIDVPREFALGLAIYEGTDSVSVTARLRYRLKDGNLRIGYTLVDADRLAREAFKAEVANTTAATGIEALYGRAAEPRS